MRTRTGNCYIGTATWRRRRASVDGLHDKHCTFEEPCEVETLTHGFAAEAGEAIPSSTVTRQGCASDGVKVPIPSIARFGRLAYPGRGEATNHERLGCKSHGCHTDMSVAVGATWVASKPAGLNVKE